jgi:hypothetical protein
LKSTKIGKTSRSTTHGPFAKSKIGVPGNNMVETKWEKFIPDVKRIKGINNLIGQQIDTGGLYQTMDGRKEKCWVSNSTTHDGRESRDVLWSIVHEFQDQVIIAILDETSNQDKHAMQSTGYGYQCELK